MENTSSHRYGRKSKKQRAEYFFCTILQRKNAGGEILLLNYLDITTAIFDRIKSPYFHPTIDKTIVESEIKKALSFLADIFKENKLI